MMYPHGVGGGGGSSRGRASSSAQPGSRTRLSTARRSYFLAGVLKDGCDGIEVWDGYGRSAVDVTEEEEEEEEDRLPFSERLDTIAGVDAVGPSGAGSRNPSAVPSLIKLCIDAVCRSFLWERQRRSIEMLPEDLANRLFYRLAHEGKILDKHLELFQKCVGEVDLSCCGRLDTTWLAYLGGFRFLRTLSLSGCSRVQGSSLWTLSALLRLESLDLSHCPRVGDDAIPHLLALQNLDSLSLAETSVSGNGAMQLAGLRNLVRLDLGGIHSISDSTVFALQDLCDLEDLELWGSSVTDEGAALLPSFAALRSLNLAWTLVTTVPPLYNLRSLNLSECKLYSVFAGWEPDLVRGSVDSLLKGGGGFNHNADPWMHRAGSAYGAVAAGEMRFYARRSRPRNAPLRVLHLCGATFLRKESIVLGSTGLADVEEISISQTEISLDFLAGLRNVAQIDMTHARDRTGKAFDMMALVGKNLVELNLSSFRNSSLPLGALAGHVPFLERISLSGAPADWSVFMYLQCMPHLRVIDLSNTNLYDHTASGSIELLENLRFLHTLILWGAKLHEDQFLKIGALRGLRRLEVTVPGDTVLPALSNLSRLTHLSVFFSAVTVAGLEALIPLRELQELDVTGCQRLQKQDLAKFSQNMPGLSVRARETNINNLTGNDGPIGILRWERWQEVDKRKVRRVSVSGEPPTMEEITRGWMGSSRVKPKGTNWYSLADLSGDPLCAWCIRNGELLTASDQRISLDVKTDAKVKVDGTLSGPRHHGIDERIHYSRKFLLELRSAPLSKRPLSSLGVAQIPNITMASAPAKNPASVVRTTSLSPPRSSSYPYAIGGVVDVPVAHGSLAALSAAGSISIPSHVGPPNQQFHPSSYPSSALLSSAPPIRNPPILGHITPAAVPSGSHMSRYGLPTSVPVSTGSIPLSSSGDPTHLPPWCTHIRK